MDSGQLIEEGMQFSMRIGDDDIRGNITSARSGPDGTINVRAKVHAKEAEDEGWRVSGRTTFVFEEISEKDGSLVGSFDVGFPLGSVDVRFFKPEDKEYIASFEAPTLTIEAALEKYGDITLDSQGSGNVFHVARIGAGELRLPVVTETFTAPYTNLLRTRMTRAVLERPGVIRVEGWYKAETDGMAHAARNVIGWGKTLREAIDAAYRSPFDSYLAFYGKAELRSQFSGWCTITGIAAGEVTHGVNEYVSSRHDHLFTSLLVSRAELVDGIVRVRGTYSMPSRTIENVEWTGEGSSFKAALSNGVGALLT